MTNSSRELALRAHIRNLLLDYSLTYLTTDYVTFTENAVSEVGAIFDTLPPQFDGL